MIARKGAKRGKRVHEADRKKLRRSGRGRRENRSRGKKGPQQAILHSKKYFFAAGFIFLHTRPPRGVPHLYQFGSWLQRKVGLPFQSLQNMRGTRGRAKSGRSISKVTLGRFGEGRQKELVRGILKK